MSKITVLEIWTMTVLSLFPWGGVWENSERIGIGGLNIKKLTVETFKTYYWRYSNFSWYNSFNRCSLAHYLFSQREDSERTLLSFARGLRWRHFRKTRWTPSLLFDASLYRIKKKIVSAFEVLQQVYFYPIGELWTKGTAESIDQFFLHGLIALRLLDFFCC